MCFFFLFIYLFVVVDVDNNIVRTERYTLTEINGLIDENKQLRLLCVSLLFRFCFLFLFFVLVFSYFTQQLLFVRLKDISKKVQSGTPTLITLTSPTPVYVVHATTLATYTQKDKTDQKRKRKHKSHTCDEVSYIGDTQEGKTSVYIYVYEAKNAQRYYFGGSTLFICLFVCLSCTI